MYEDLARQILKGHFFGRLRDHDGGLAQGVGDP